MKQYLILILAILTTTLGLTISCTAFAPDLSQKDKDTFSFMGFEVGYSWGYWNSLNAPVYWVTPDKYEPFHRKFYIPKGYWTMEDVADTHFPDGTLFNEKQRRQAMEAYNWMFYAGYCRGAQDRVQGKPYSCKP